MRRRASFALASLLTIASTLSCGGASFVQTADRALTTALATTDAARDQFLAWDKAHQLELVELAESRDAAEAALAAYRAKRQPLIQAFVATYTLIGVGASMLPLVERGVKQEVDLIAALSEVMSAVTTIRDGYRALKGLE